MMLSSAAICEKILEDIHSRPDWDLSGESYPYVDEAWAESYLSQED